MDAPIPIEDFLSKVAQVLDAANEESAQEALDLLRFATGTWVWTGGYSGVTNWEIDLVVPFAEHAARRPADIELISKNVAIAGNEVLSPRRYDQHHLKKVRIETEIEGNTDWRRPGSAINNQGRVRSDNVAPIEEDGLRFRSPAEVRLYKALKARGLTFAPLPVFVRGGRNYRRLEPDFLIIKDGIVYQVEVDGDTVHRESPAQAQKRTAPMAFEGVEIHRIASSEIRDDEEATKRVAAIIMWIEKTKQNRR